MYGKSIYYLSQKPFICFLIRKIHLRSQNNVAAAVSVLLALIAKMYPAVWIRRRGLKILINDRCPRQALEDPSGVTAGEVCSKDRKLVKILAKSDEKQLR